LNKKIHGSILLMSAMDRSPDVDLEDWEEYLSFIIADEQQQSMENIPELTEEQYWALLAVYESAAETLIKVSDGPGYHVPLMSVLDELGVVSQTRWEVISVARLILEKYEASQMDKMGT
jgi:hypothetical protein